MIKSYNYKNLEWIDLDNPTQDEVREIIDKYSIDPMIGNELLSPTIKPYVDYRDDYIYLILHFPISYDTKQKEGVKKIEEVDFIIGRNFIITTRYQEVDALLQFSKIFEVESILNKSDMGDHAGFLFFYMIQHLYKNLTNRLETVRDSLNQIESKIFSGEEKEMVLEISKVNRLLLVYKDSIVLHKEVLGSFMSAAEKFFDQNFNYHLNVIMGEYYKVQNSINSAKDYLDELRETNDSLLTTKQNEIMKILTVTTFLFLPLSLIAGIFGMNTKHMPIIGHQNDFITIILIMIIVIFVTFIYFRFKKWL